MMGGGVSMVQIPAHSFRFSVNPAFRSITHYLVSGTQLPRQLQNVLYLRHE